MKRLLTSTIFLAIISINIAGAADQAASIKVQVDKPGIKTSSTLYGIFFEAINRADDGGIYAEMIQNRSFEDRNFPVAWTLVKSSGAEGAMSLDKTQPLNKANPTSLKMEISKMENGRVGIANDGFKGCPYPLDRENMKWLPEFEKAVSESQQGIAVAKGKEYLVSLYARAGSGFQGSLTVSIEKQDGTVIASHKVSDVGAEWKKFDCRLTANTADCNARFVVSADKTGTVWLDMLSMFPKDTFKERPNGIRADLAKMLLDMKPAFVRFPGGCFVEGDELVYASRWKETIGDIAERPGHWNRWGYQSTEGLGYFEYLQLCEDLNAEPLFVINCGMAHKDHVPMDQMGPWVQDALDAIEYANGPADSKWGSLRAKAGHPAPFNMKYMEIGNENGGPIYNERYKLFYDAIKAKYPGMNLIADGRVPSPASTDIVDEHYYNSPQFFMNNADKYDKYERGGMKVYIGEYAVTRNAGKGNLDAAIGEAVFMTGMERNSDVVIMASYAPLFERDGWKRWNPNAIHFDASRIYGTPSYHCQAMFANNRADTVLPLELESAAIEAEPVGGMIGVGTWNTEAEFKDIKVTRNDKVMFESDFSKNTKGWKTLGTWKAKDGAICFDGGTNVAKALTGSADWTDYTLTLKARKTGGKEGFLVIFKAKNDKDKSWWNIGGWGNSAHGLEIPGIKDLEKVPGKIETGRWYDIKVETKGSVIKCYLDGKLIHETKYPPVKAVYANAGMKGPGEVVLKIINVSNQPVDTKIILQGGKATAPSAKALVLTGSGRDDENTFEEPSKIVPKEETIQNVKPEFTRILPANSINILTIKTE